MVIDPKIEQTWKEELILEFQKDYFFEIKNFLIEEKKANKIIYPPGPKIFEAFRLTPINDVKIVILGQDPYHGNNQAHGLCFSVLEPTPPPPSLVNIFKELETDLGFSRPKHGNLSSWARQGVFLLNTVLTVAAGNAGSHRKKGWERFTDFIIKLLSQRQKHLVFILWGRDAQSKHKLITGDHLVLEAPHPSPLSAHTGFFGSKPFSQANNYLESNGLSPINWSIS